MIYLEDYIELIEQLPADLRDRFTDMRELDLKVQNKIDALDGRVRRFFSDARADPKSEALAPEYESMHTCYEQALEDADEKVSIASRIYELVERHLRKLDQELGKFKLELEADCSGITEILERRSLMYDENGDAAASDKLKRKLDPVLLNGGAPARSSFSHPLGASYPPSNAPTISSSPRNPSTATHGLGAHSNSALSKVPSKSSLPSSKPNPSMKELQCGRGAQASLKAMSAAQKKAEQLGNKLNLSGLLGSSTSSSSLSKPPGSSYTDVTAGSAGSGSSGSGSSGSYLPSMASTPPSLSSQQKSIVSLHGTAGSRMPKVSRRGQKTISSSHTSTSSLPSMMQTTGSYPEPSLDWVPDPNEPTYCLCGQVSYGEMVGCDNASCAVEWFHYGCVGLTDAPKGKWYCPDCTAQIKKRRAR